jgi:hypothetical protein
MRIVIKKNGMGHYMASIHSLLVYDAIPIKVKENLFEQYTEYKEYLMINEYQIDCYGFFIDKQQSKKSNLEYIIYKLTGNSVITKIKDHNANLRR